MTPEEQQELQEKKLAKITQELRGYCPDPQLETLNRSVNVQYDQRKPGVASGKPPTLTDAINPRQTLLPNVEGPPPHRTWWSELQALPSKPSLAKPEPVLPEHEVLQPNWQVTGRLR